MLGKKKGAGFCGINDEVMWRYFSCLIFSDLLYRLLASDDTFIKVALRCLRYDFPAAVQGAFLYIHL